MGPKKPQMVSPFRIVLIFLAVAALSVAVLPYLHVELLPKGNSTKMLVQFSLPGGAPETVEQQATALLEGVLSQLRGLTKIESVSGYNGGSITLEFGPKTDMEAREFELHALLRQVFPRLPAGVSYPKAQRVGDVNTQARQSPFIAYTVEGPAAAFQIRKTAESVFRKGLAEIGGLREIQISGAPSLQLAIRFYPDKLAALGLPADALGSALRDQFQIQYPGSAYNQRGEVFFIQFRHLPASLETIERLPIALPHGGRVLLKEVAKASLEEEQPGQYYRINGKNSVLMALQAREGQNAIALSRKVRALVPRLSRQLPAGYAVRLEYDQTEYLSKELTKTYRRTAWSMSILVLFILLAYRDWRSLAALLSGLMVNLGLTLLLVWAFGVPVHLYTLAGVAIAFGIMIDNAVVMLDYYRQHRKRLVFTSIMGATLTTVAALGLVFLLPPEERQNLQDFALVVCLSLAASLAVALGFIPGMYELLRGKKAAPPARMPLPKRWRVRSFRLFYRFTAFCARFRPLYLGLWALALGLPLFLLPAKIEGWALYNATIGAPGYQEKVRPIVDRLTGGALRLFLREVFERSGYRDFERTRLMVRAELPHGATPQQMDFLLRRMEDILEGVEGVEKYVTNVYSGEEGRIEITFTPAYERSALPYVLRSRLIARSTDWSGVNWGIYGVGQGFGTGVGESIPSYRVPLMGYNYDQLAYWAGELKTMLETHPRVQKVSTDGRLEYDEKSAYIYRLQFDREKLARKGVNMGPLLSALQASTLPLGAQVQGAVGGESYPVRLAAYGSESFSTFDLMGKGLALDTVRTVRLGEAATLNWEKTTAAIHRQNRRYVRMVHFEYTGSYVFGGRFLNETLEKLNARLPAGYEAKREEYRSFWEGKSAKNRWLLLLALLGANFFICAILFESFRKPLAVIAMIPLSLIGLFLTFAWGGFYFDQGGYAAMVLLGGISVNAAIFVVNDYMHHPGRGRRPNRALLLALVQRGRTIVLTVVSTICGLIPFLSGGDAEVFWFALAVGATGGLLFSLFAVFTALPVMMWKGVGR